MNKIVMSYATYAGIGGSKYSGTIDIIIDSVTYEVTIHAITKPSPGKASSYIEQILDKKTGKSAIDSNKKIINQSYRQLYRLLLGVDIALKTHQDKSKGLSAREALSQLTFSFEATDEFSIIPGHDLSDEEIKTITSSKENNKKLFSSTTLIELTDFLAKWKALIVRNALEREFQDLLMEYKKIIPILFGYSGEAIKKEEALDEGATNYTDISGEDWIIELKRPTTDLFSSSKSRNNLEGISSAFISADNQLDLYIKKKNRENNLFDSFTTGTLIIGNSDQLVDDDKKMAFGLMREKSRSNILLFDDVSKKIEKLIEELKK